MSHKKFHLGYFSSFGPPAWHASSGQDAGSDWANGRYFAQLARRLEQAHFDLLFFEDTSTVSRALGDSMETDLKYALYSPKNDPVALISYLSAVTEKIGLVATASTTFYPPYLLARALSTIDSLSNGRVGWNVVTSSENHAARNFGIESLPPAHTRYDIAEEFMDVVTQLWSSWEEGAVVRDLASGVYVDHTKVHEINYKGQHYASLGPLNTIPSPQRKPVIVQAGTSERGRDFSARHAEVIFAPTAGGIPAMKALRDDIRARAARFGRDPDTAKVIFAAPVRFTEGKGAPLPEFTARDFEITLAFYSSFMDLDLSKFDPDLPIPETAQARGHTSFLDFLKEGAKKGMTLRQGLIEQYRGASDVGLVGSPEEVAENLAHTMDAVGGDGFLILAAREASDDYVSKVVDRLAPRLQEIGAMRTAYSGSTLRENLLAF